LKTLEKRNGKAIRKFRKKEKGKEPSSAQPGRAPARPRRLTGGIHLSAATPSPVPRTLLSRSLPSGPKLSALVSSPARPSSLSALRARFASHRAVAPARLLSPSLCCGPPLSVPPTPRPPWTSAHVARILGHDARPCAPAPFLSPTHAHTHSLASFHAAPLSLALCPRRPTSPETRACLPGHLAHRRPCQATPSSAPR
jgi:hypothetical protein